MNAPRAAAIPARNAEPYPRASTRTTRAPRFSAISIEPSVEPLSATTTSPRIPISRNAANALSTQIPIERASLRQGITTEISGALREAVATVGPGASIRVAEVLGDIISSRALLVVGSGPGFDG